MKKYILAAVLVLASTSAMADRMESAAGRNTTKVTACRDAKSNAASLIGYEEHVERYSACSCDTDKFGYYECNVDITFEKDKK